MEHNNNGQHPIEDADNKARRAGNVQAPSTLLPNVLRQLGLDNGSTPSSSQLNDSLAALNGQNWQTRIAAVHTLHTSGNAGIPIEPLLAALNDEDSSVRAAAVYALGTMGERIPLDRLISALQDDNWHVRETALLILGKLEQHVPLEPLMRAVHDTDAAVREAAQMALQCRGRLIAPIADLSRPSCDNLHAFTVQLLIVVRLKKRYT